MRIPKGVETVLILALVAGLVYFSSRPKYRGLNGGLTMCKANLKNVGTALEMYATDWDGNYPTTLGLLTPNYLKTVPTCAEAWDQDYDYTPYFSKEFYSFECQAHRGVPSEACRNKLRRLRALATAKPSEVPVEEQFTDLACPSGTPYLYVTHYETYRISCSGNNHHDSLKDPEFNGVDGLF
jgi:hypothetical protein